MGYTRLGRPQVGFRGGVINAILQTMPKGACLDSVSKEDSGDFMSGKRIYLGPGLAKHNGRVPVTTAVGELKAASP